MTLTREEARQRGALLKQLRDQHAESVERTRALLKEQQTIRRQICQQLRSAPKTVPEIAAATGLLAQDVLWHVTAMKKYDRIVEVGQCGEYYQYAMAKEEDA
jgi:predicted Rossmann fold nucleotide-binding protein DprA/Smf involved in DNA uptake